MVKRLEWDAVTEIKVSEPRTLTYGSEYSEQPTRYMVKILGVNRWRRVYACALGNAAVLYLKSKDGLLYCETAVEHAVNCTSRSPEQGPCGHDYEGWLASQQKLQCN